MLCLLEIYICEIIPIVIIEQSIFPKMFSEKLFIMSYIERCAKNNFRLKLPYEINNDQNQELMHLKNLKILNLNFMAKPVSNFIPAFFELILT